MRTADALRARRPRPARRRRRLLGGARSSSPTASATRSPSRSPSAPPRCCAPSGRRPASVARVLRDEKPTVFCAVPTLFAALLADEDVRAHGLSPALRISTSAGEGLPRHLGEAWRARFGSDILDGIGSTEMLHIFISNRPGDVRYGTTGTRAAIRCRPNRFLAHLPHHQSNGASDHSWGSPSAGSSVLGNYRWPQSCLVGGRTQYSRSATITRHNAGVIAIAAIVQVFSEFAALQQPRLQYEVCDGFLCQRMAKRTVVMIDVSIKCIKHGIDSLPCRRPCLART